MPGPDILLTNDDGIDAPGLRALSDALEDIASVTAVAPAEDQSAVGRAISNAVSVREHELGYVIDGTPVDCVVAGLTSLVPETDLVIAGCNCGGNLGAAVLGRSGTVSAAVEATFFDLPAMAVSMYIPAGEFDVDDKREIPKREYEEAARGARHLVDSLKEDLFEEADYLNINAPVRGHASGEMAITRPSHVYRLEAVRDGGTIELRDNIWGMMANGKTPDPEGTDRRAVLDGVTSVSPLTAPHSTERHERLAALAGRYPPQN
jgi:5'-nucleotidase